MSRCALTRRVFFCEEPIFDASSPELVVERLDNGLHTVVPHLPPGPSRERTERLQRDLLEELVTRARIDAPLLWMYTPMALGFARHLRPSMIVYDCMDELSGFVHAPPGLGERERELFALADLVFTGGQSLYEAKRLHHPNVHAFPSSVDAGHFAGARLPGTEPEPEDQRAIPHPRLGFFGVIDERMDLELLRRLAEAHPEWQLVFVGPVVKIDPASLPLLPNIHYLGRKSYDELPSYIAGWDVALMPFAMNDATRFISPTKTLEYLAAGKPVVSTPIRDVARPYGDEGLVRIAADAETFAFAVAEALAEVGTPPGEARRRRADALVAETSWDKTWTRMHALIDEIDLSRRARVNATQEAAPCSTT
jgi:UDP-galactopyranose mutase